MGLKYHLISSHDQFNFEFWISEKEQGVNVSLKRNTWTNEDFPAGVDPRQRTFSYFSKYKKRPRLVVAKVAEAIVPSKVTEVIIPLEATEVTVLPKATETIVPPKATEIIRHGHLLGTSVSDTSVDPACSLHGGHLSPPRILEFGKTRRLSVNQINPRKYVPFVYVLDTMLLS